MRWMVLLEGGRSRRWRVQRVQSTEVRVSMRPPVGSGQHEHETAWPLIVEASSAHAAAEAAMELFDAYGNAGRDVPPWHGSQTTTFFDWYEPEESPPVVEVPEDCRATVFGSLRQLFFSWYEE